jgi:hypothetical protein
VAPLDTELQGHCGPTFACCTGPLLEQLRDWRAPNQRQLGATRIRLPLVASDFSARPAAIRRIVRPVAER